MAKSTHRNVAFSKEEMAYQIPDNIDLTKLPFVGRGLAGMEMARRISRAKGAEKRKLVESLPREESVAKDQGVQIRLDRDVATVFNDSKSVNNVLRALIQNMPVAEKKKYKKTA